MNLGQHLGQVVRLLAAKLRGITARMRDWLRTQRERVAFDPDYAEALVSALYALLRLLAHVCRTGSLLHLALTAFAEILRSVRP